MQRAIALFPLLLSCATAKPEDTDSGGSDAFEFGECTPTEGEWPLSSGTYTTSIDEAIYNHCENAVGNGYHIHVGEENPLTLTTDQNCLTADASGMLMAGETTETQLQMLGYIDMEHGLCTMRISATLTGTITGDNAFDYEVEAVAAPVNDTDKYCEMMVGDSEGATFPYIPCDYAWRGRAWLP